MANQRVIETRLEAAQRHVKQGQSVVEAQQALKIARGSSAGRRASKPTEPTSAEISRKVGQAMYFDSSKSD